MKTEEGVRDFFNKTGLYLHKRFGIMLRRNMIKQLTQVGLYKSVLDVGCGDGTLVLDFVENADQVVLIDLSENMLGLAKTNIESAFRERTGKVEYYNGDFASYESNNHFDLILLIGVLAHVPDLEIVFTKLKSLLNHNGIVIIQYSDSNHLIIKMRHWWHRKNSTYSLNMINEGLIQELCNRHDFSTVAKKRFNFPFFGMKYLSDTTLYKFQCWLLNQRWLSFLLSDVMIVLNKNGRS